MSSLLATDRVQFDLDDVCALHDVLRELRGKFVEMRTHLPAIPFAEEHVKAENLCDDVSAKMVALDRLLGDVKNDLRAKFVALAAEEAEEMKRAWEARGERIAIQEESSSPGLFLLPEDGRCASTAKLDNCPAEFRCSLPAGHDRQHEARAGDGRVLAVWYPPLDQLTAQTR
jgi:hypothetical protein